MWNVYTQTSIARGLVQIKIFWEIDVAIGEGPRRISYINVPKVLNYQTDIKIFIGQQLFITYYS